MFDRLNTFVRSTPRPVAAALAIFGSGLVWAYWPTIGELVHRWSTDSQYSHGFIVPVFALILLALRRQQMEKVRFGFYWWGLPLLALGTVARLLGTYFYFDWLEAASLLPCLAGLAVLLGGKRALWWAWPSIAFLVFMIPLPYRIEVAAAGPLRRIATLLSTYALQTCGLPAIAEGNTIILDHGTIGVVEACSGLSMLETFFALSTAVAIVIRRVWWEKIALVLSAVPIAVLVNVIRITITGILHEIAGRELAELVFHELAGLIMMPMALGLLGIELIVLARLMSPPASGAVLQAQATESSAQPGAPSEPAKRKRHRNRNEKASIPR